MQKEILYKSIIKEMKIVRRLSTKIPAEQINFRLKEDIRSTFELLQYISYSATGMLQYWFREDQSVEFRPFYATLTAHSKTITRENFIAEMDRQMELVTNIFEKFTEADLYTKEVDYPWGEKAVLAEAILETCIKWITGYKMQLFLKLKLSSDEKLGTPDLWRKTEMDLV